MNDYTPRLLEPGPELAGIKLLCCDIDGVQTDGSLYYDANGHSLVRFHVLDGMGLKLVMRHGIRTCFISQSRSPAILARASVLGIDYCMIGVEDKLTPVMTIAAEMGIAMSQVCHIADDINDLSLLNAVGVAVTVPRGVATVKAVCQFVTATQGGEGAVRELCDALIASQVRL